jgi:hypothetical protein
MRFAACLSYENGVTLHASVHDAFLYGGPLEDEAAIVATLTACMGRASSILLDGAVIRTETDVYRHPDRFRDKDGWPTWTRIMDALGPIIPPGVPTRRGEGEEKERG